jgi:hypothetical protein
MRGRPFQPGNKYSRGRPRGSRNKAARVCQNTLESLAEPLTKKCLSLAFQGSPTALRLCMERLMPARRQRALHFKLPPTKNLVDVVAASESVLSGVVRGELTPAEGEALSGMLDGRRRMIETQELEQRIRALEALNKPSNELR